MSVRFKGWPHGGVAIAMVGFLLVSPTFVNATAQASRRACRGEEATIVGTDKADQLEGTEGPDVIVALGGNDQITIDQHTGNGEDLICAGPGDDFVKVGDPFYDGTEGSHRVYAGSGDDKIRGDNQDDCCHAPAELNGGRGNDVILGGLGSDVLRGAAGADKINGGNWGDDVISGGRGNDEVFGGRGCWWSGDEEICDDGDDLIGGGAGDDILSGGTGDDFIRGGEGADTLTGDYGHDALFGEQGIDSIDGGYGIDECHGETMVACEGPDWVPKCRGLEATVFGTVADDDLLGTDGDDVIAGLDGSDTIDGGGGDDLVCGGAGNDVIEGGGGVDGSNEGSDLLLGEVGDDTISIDSTDGGTVEGGEGFDALDLSSQTEGVSVDLSEGSVVSGERVIAHLRVDPPLRIEAVLGTPHDDTIMGSDLSNDLHGGSGDDLLIGGVAGALIYGEEGNDTLEGRGKLTGGPGADLLRGRDLSSDTLEGNEGPDTLEGQGGSDSLHGGPGDDFLDGGEGDYDTARFHDALEGVTVNLHDGTAAGDGNDLIVDVEWVFGSRFADSLTGNDQNNSLSGWLGDDILIGLGGDDALYGDLGNDSCYQETTEVDPVSC